ncbi:MAG: flotillin-like protein FloA [Planctomycetota bacterium]
MGNGFLILGGIVGGIFALVVFFMMLSFLNLWIQCITTGADIGLFDLLFMRLRKVNLNTIVQAQILSVQAGLPMTRKDLENHYLQGGNVINVVKALIAAGKADLGLTWKTATGIDLAGRDILGAVRRSVDPEVIICPTPSPGKDTVDAVAMDGIQLKAKARVTVRTNISQLIGGATEETIIARVCEGIVTAIGSAKSHKEVLASPDLISRRVMEKGLDAGTAFEILSIDIADVDVGDNIGAKLMEDQAESDKKVAQAQAEKQRALAVAREQEMKALTQENRAKVVLAEAEIPQAISAAFRSGNMGVMDYYRLKNLQSDTQMRDTIGKTSGPNI